MSKHPELFTISLTENEMRYIATSLDSSMKEAEQRAMDAFSGGRKFDAWTVMDYARRLQGLRDKVAATYGGNFYPKLK